GPEEILDSDRELILRRYLELTRAALEKEPGVELVLWPETVVTLVMKNGALLQRQQMIRLAGELGVDLLYGAQIYSGETPYNSIVFLSPQQGRTQVYHKQRLVPFVEYFPLEGQLNRWLDLDFKIGRYRAGDEYSLFSHRRGPLAGAICFESYFGDYTRRFARRGGRHLFIATNDVWFGESIGLEQHAQVAALRAAEMGIGVTQVANSGISISFDYRGRELMRTGKGERGFHILKLDLARRNTLYRLAGDFFPPLSLLLVAAAVLALRKSRSPSPPPGGSPHRKSR
ncbi:MAG: apolipoprotein N-acyltransferase, partial [Firmicutes bacterium]|nr:apolipoprotein N-acyltransferase [Bacillota bacterium]